MPQTAKRRLWARTVSSRTGFQTQGFFNPKFRLLIFTRMAWFPTYLTASLPISFTGFSFFLFLRGSGFPGWVLQTSLYSITFFLDYIISLIVWTLTLFSFHFSLGITAHFQLLPGLSTWLPDCRVDTSGKHMLILRSEQDIRLFGHLVLHLWNEGAGAVVFKLSFWSEDHCFFWNKFLHKTNH